jgi:putative peptidoglycan lipid II flippase
MLPGILIEVRRWWDWPAQSANRRILAAALTVGALGSAVKLTGALKFIVIAHVFGTSAALGSFLIAFLPLAFLGEVLGSSFSGAIIPILIEVRQKEDRASAQRFISSVALCSTVVLVTCAGLLGLTSGGVLRLLGSGFTAADLDVSHNLLLIMLPIVVLSGLSALGRTVLNAGERFALAALSPSAIPLITIVLLLSPVRQWGAYALAFGTVLGGAVELLVVTRGLERHGYKLVPRWHGMNPTLRLAATQYAPVVAGALLLNGSTLADQAIAAMLGPASVSAFNYAGKLITVILSIAATALSTAALPHFSKMVASGDWNAMRNTISTYRRWVFAATVPATAVLIYFSEPLVRVIFQKGAFTDSDTHLVATVQRFCLLQIPFSMATVLVTRLISSLKANHILMWAAAITLPLHIALDYVLMRRMGIAGIALATAIVSVVSFCFLSWMLRLLVEHRRSG